MRKFKKGQKVIVVHLNKNDLVFMEGYFDKIDNATVSVVLKTGWTAYFCLEDIGKCIEISRNHREFIGDMKKLIKGIDNYAWFTESTC